MDDSKKAQNLARIRDNQRRSRARRKDYMHELEARLRDYEQMGIEASSEIQGAARRVLDENRKLRSMLHERGVSDSDILVATGGSTEELYDQYSASVALNSMLERKITCRPHAYLTSPVLSQRRDLHNDSHTSTNHVFTMQMPHSTALSSNDSPSPHSMVSGMGTPPPFQSTPYSNNLTPEPEMSPEGVPRYMAYAQPLQNSWPQLHQLHQQREHRQQYVTDSTNYYNSGSCVDATNVIRTMRTARSSELAFEPGQHCYVTDPMVFNDIESYPGAHVI